MLYYYLIRIDTSNYIFGVIRKLRNDIMNNKFVTPDKNGTLLLQIKWYSLLRVTCFKNFVIT